MSTSTPYSPAAVTACVYRRAGRMNHPNFDQIDFSLVDDDEHTPQLPTMTEVKLRDEVAQLEKGVRWLRQERARLQEQLYDQGKMRPRYYQLLWGPPTAVSLMVQGRGNMGANE